MTRYLIEAPHTKEECLRNLDQTLAKGPDILGKFFLDAIAENMRRGLLWTLKTEAKLRNCSAT